MLPPAPPSPATSYWERLQQRASEAASTRRTHFLLGYLRVLLVAIAITLGWFSWGERTFSPLWILLPCAIFVVLMRVHGRILHRRSTALRAVDFYESGIARMEEQWGGQHPRQVRIDTSQSLFAADLGLFDPNGTFDLLCTARTPMGEDTLAEWLLQPATVREITARHAAISDLHDRLDLREDMGVTGGNTRAPLDTAALLAWAEGNPPVLPTWIRWLAPLLLLLTIAAAIWSARLQSLAPLLLMLVIDAIFTFSYRKPVEAILAGARRASESLTLFSVLIARIERESFTADRLVALQAQLASGGPASTAMARLARLAEFIDYRLNYIVRIVDVPLLYSLQLTGYVQAWRRRYGRSCRDWLGVLGEMEALLSLSTYTYEHPQDVMPEISVGAPVFEAEALGHPLLPIAHCVRNDVQLGGDARLLLVTGSNMSGKSTLLRAIGINAVLALAGAPVRASSLRLTPMRLGADIGINDSLAEGRSRFYAEILRLGAVCELAELHPPVLFLLDELLGGTNSVDRLAGAQGVADWLLRSGAIGLISTHDLALTEIGGDVTPFIRQQHFDERIVDRRMEFDYILKPGAVTTRNGLELMRLIGLKV